MRDFGLGSLCTIPSGATPTPVQCGLLEEISWDFKEELKPLNGQYRTPVDMGRGKGTYMIKAKIREFRADILGVALQGSSTVTGSILGVTSEAGLIPTTPFQITVANGATFSEDCGVLDLSTGKWMTRGATATGTNVYAVNTATGVYTFNTADAGHNVAISYTYTSASIGKTVTLSNQVMGASTGFSLRCFNIYGGKPLGLKFYNVHTPGLAAALKADDWAGGDIEFQAIQDTASLKVFDAYVGD